MIYSQFDKAVDDKIRNDEKEEPEVKVISEEEVLKGAKEYGDVTIKEYINLS